MLRKYSVALSIVLGLVAISAPTATAQISMNCPGLAEFGTVGVSFSSPMITVNGGTAPYTFSWGPPTPFTDPPPPPGLTLNTSANTPVSGFGAGAVTGTPTTPGQWVLQVTDSSSPPLTATNCAVYIKPPTTFVCVIPPSGTEIPGAPVSWNKFNTQGANNVVWINAHIGKPNGVPTNEVTTVLFTGVTFVLNGTTYNLPDGVLTFDPSAPATPATNFNINEGLYGTWVTRISPNDLSDEIWFDGNAVPVDSNISGGGSATFNYTTDSNDNDLAFNWQWSAAVYTDWPVWTGVPANPDVGNNAALILAYHNSDHAGTPENKTVQKSLIQGPRGGGGSNYTGSWSGTGNGACPGAK